MSILIIVFGSLNVNYLNHILIYNNDSLLLFSLLLLLVAAQSKSGQFGFHTWLLNAMEAPGPVSSLLHSATMVIAGVYLIQRISSLLILSPYFPIIVLVFGSFSALFASINGLIDNDIKKIIAYSTVSQLGYLFVAAGAYQFDVALFHIINHSFFKSLLFISAGVIIHSQNDDQDLRKYGALVFNYSYIYLTIFVGSLSLMAFPYLSGFYSKDLLLSLLFVDSSIRFYAYIMCFVAAIFTSLYSQKIVIMTFLSKAAMSRQAYSNLHGTPFSVLFLTTIQIFGSIFSGYLLSSSWSSDTFALWSNSFGSLLVPNLNMAFIASDSFEYTLLLNLVSLSLIPVSLSINSSYRIYRVLPIMNNFNVIYSFIIKYSLRLFNKSLLLLDQNLFNPVKYYSIVEYASIKVAYFSRYFIVSNLLWVVIGLLSLTFGYTYLVLGLWILFSQ